MRNTHRDPEVERAVTAVGRGRRFAVLEVLFQHLFHRADKLPPVLRAVTSKLSEIDLWWLLGICFLAARNLLFAGCP